jgi:hypothetical protein
MFKRTLLLFILIGAFLEGTAQQVVQSLPKNTFFLELGGNGMFYSLNYDRILLDRPTWKIAARIGGMYFPGLGESNRHMIGLPLEISYLKGRNNHHLEVGLGFTSVYDTYPLAETQLRELAVMGVGRIGYRYQKREGGLFFKTGFTPLLGTVYNLGARERRGSEPFAYPLVGLAFGYTLKR